MTGLVQRGSLVYVRDVYQHNPLELGIIYNESHQATRTRIHWIHSYARELAFANSM